MIIGLDWFGQAEYAHVIDHDIREWLLPCEPDTKWTDINEALGRDCSGRNTTDHWGCFTKPDFYPPEQEVDQNGLRRWNNYFRSRGEQS